jgi:MFS family permease
MTDTATSTIAHIIQLAVAPVFLLAGIGSLLNVLAGRLSRIVDRARMLERHIPSASDEQRLTEIAELEILERRMSICHWAIGLCTTAALLICLVVMILFVSDLVALRFSVPVSLLFIAAMLSLTLGLLLFLGEVTIATRFVHVSEEFVERRKRGRGRKHDG